MNKTIYLFFALFSILLISCKKEHTCSCQQTVVTTAYTQYGNYHPQSITSYNFSNTYKLKESAAITNCNNFEKINSYSTGSGEAQRTTTETVECELY